MHEAVSAAANGTGGHIEGRHGVSTFGRGVSDGQGETRSARSETFHGGDRARR